MTHAPPSEPYPRAIEMRGITKRFGDVVANDAISFDARIGEVHALVGENGAGKSTLMSILAGIYRPDAGVLAVNGDAVDFRSPKDAIARGIGMVYQHFMLVESFSVTENIALGQPGGKGRLDLATVAREVRALGDRFGLDIDPAAKIWQLSVGEQQRVEIVRLLHRGARILVFDEPTAVLTPRESASLLATLRGMAAQGFCVVFISHKLDEVLAVADRITVLRRGRTVVTTSATGTDRGQLARSMVGRDLASTLLTERHADAHQTGPVRLAMSDLQADGDNGFRALNGVSLDVNGGEILGVAGVAGNGQRELAEAVTGLRRVVGGRVTVEGVDVTNRSAAIIARAGVAHVPEDRSGTGLVRDFDLAGNAILRSYRSRPITRGPFLATRAVARFADRLIRDQDIQPANRTARLRDLSGGNQQKLLLARELATDPTVLVAVHPTRGVDVGATEAIHTALRAQRDRGTATLLISEDLGELLELSDRVAVMFAGRIVGVVAAHDANLDDIGLMMAGSFPEPIPA